MRALSATELLNVWERGSTETPARRALLLLEKSCTDLPLDEIPQLTIGRRDDRLLTLREMTFGPRLDLLAACPKCNEQLEIYMNVAELRVPPQSTVGSELAVEAAGHQVRFRPLTGADLARLSSTDNPEKNRMQLLKACLFSCVCGGQAMAVEQLPEELLILIGNEMVRADPQAEVQLSVDCPSCRHSWQQPFDIVSFLWAEIHARAVRLLHEIHFLASAYGWTEGEILSLSAQRRRTYLQLNRV
jgi:hypothetical protein